MILKRIQISLIFFSFWMLAIVAPTVSFAPGKWEATDQKIAGSPPSLETFLGFLLTLAAISFVCFSGLFLWKTVRTKKRKDDDRHDFYREPIPASPLVYAVILLLLATMAGLVWWMGQPSKVPEQSSQPRPSFVSPPSSKPSPVAPPKGVPDHGFPEPSTLEHLLAIILLGGLSWVVWHGLKFRPSKQEPISPDQGRIAAQAAIDLDEGKELSEIVLRCYRDMCAIMARKVAIREEMTAREFAEHLRDEGVREEEVFRLTALFERVRYGRYIAGPEERAEAITLLKAIENRYGKNVEDR
jgi:hypothetical protein